MFAFLFSALLENNRDACPRRKLLTLRKLEEELKRLARVLPRAFSAFGIAYRYPCTPSLVPRNRGAPVWKPLTNEARHWPVAKRWRKELRSHVHETGYCHEADSWSSSYADDSLASTGYAEAGCDDPANPGCHDRRYHGPYHPGDRGPGPDGPCTSLCKNHHHDSHRSGRPEGLSKCRGHGGDGDPCIRQE